MKINFNLSYLKGTRISQKLKLDKLSKKKKNEFAEYRDVLELCCYYFRIELQLSTIGYFNTGSQSILKCHFVLRDSVY